MRIWQIDGFEIQEQQGDWECRRMNKLIGWASSTRANFCPKNTMSVPGATNCLLWKQGGDQLFHQQARPVQCPVCKVLYSCWSSGCIWRGDNTCPPLSEGGRKNKLQGFQFIFLACPHFFFAATANSPSLFSFLFPLHRSWVGTYREITYIQYRGTKEGKLGS